MRVGVLFSGGKDSTLALHYASRREQVVCLITLLSQNKESYMFHTPNVEITALQADALGLPRIAKTTAGLKEKELEDLEAAIVESVRKFKIEGVVTGAVESGYQSQRIQFICRKLGLWCFNPLWKHDQKALLEELLDCGFEVIISGIFAYPLDETWLGRQLDTAMITELVDLQRRYGISPSGEGGEIETTVLDAPLFKKKIEILNRTIDARGNSGVLKVTKAWVVAK